MKLLALLYLGAGLLLTLLVLKVVHRDWEDFGGMALWALGLNSIVALLAYAIFRRSREFGMDGLLLILGYAAGIAGGFYFYNS